MFFLLSLTIFGCEKALADEGKSDLQTIKTATITTSVNGYTSGGAYANVEKSYYNTGETLNLKWKGAAVGSDFVIPTSVKYSASSTEITSDKLISINLLQSKNTDYKKFMGQEYTMTTYESLKNYVASEHLFELGEVIGDASVTVEFARVTPIYRMYDMITSEHLFTTDKSEYDGFQKKLDGRTEFWIGEGIDWLAPSSSSTVVHRLYNAALGAMYRSSHYYTSDKNEINRLIKKYGWVDDGTTKQFYSGGSTPIYTCYNEALGSAHHYTSRGASGAD